MRSLVCTAILGSFIALSLQAQSLTEHAAAAAGATAGAAAGKPVSNAITKIFGQVDNDAAKAAKPDDSKNPNNTAKPAAPPADPKSEPNPIDNPSYARPRRQQSSAAPAPVSAATQYAAPTAPLNPPLIATVARPVVPDLPLKEPSPEEFASIKVGVSNKEMVALLGPPVSRVSVPDDDGHLRESCQYWAKGKQLGTIRLDNGQVVTVETRAR